MSTDRSYSGDTGSRSGKTTLHSSGYESYRTPRLATRASSRDSNRSIHSAFSLATRNSDRDQTPIDKRRLKKRRDSPSTPPKNASSSDRRRLAAETPTPVLHQSGLRRKLLGARNMLPPPTPASTQHSKAEVLESPASPVESLSDTEAPARNTVMAIPVPSPATSFKPSQLPKKSMQQEEEEVQTARANDKQEHSEEEEFGGGCSDEDFFGASDYETPVSSEYPSPLIAVEAAVRTRSSEDALASSIVALINSLDHTETDSISMSEGRHLHREHLLAMYYLEGSELEAHIGDNTIMTLIANESAPPDNVFLADPVTLGLWLGLPALDGDVPHLQKMLDTDNMDGQELISKLGYPLVELSDSTDRIVFVYNGTRAHWVLVTVDHLLSSKPTITLYDHAHETEHIRATKTMQRAQEEIPQLMQLAALNPQSPFRGRHHEWQDIRITSGICARQDELDIDCGLFVIFEAIAKIYELPAPPFLHTNRQRREFGQWMRQKCAARLENIWKAQVSGSAKASKPLSLLTSVFPRFENDSHKERVPANEEGAAASAKSSFIPEQHLLPRKRDKGKGRALDEVIDVSNEESAEQTLLSILSPLHENSVASAMTNMLANTGRDALDISLSEIIYLFLVGSPGCNALTYSNSGKRRSIFCDDVLSLRNGQKLTVGMLDAAVDCLLDGGQVLEKNTNVALITAQVSGQILAYAKKWPTDPDAAITKLLESVSRLMEPQITKIVFIINVREHWVAGMARCTGEITIYNSATNYAKHEIMTTAIGLADKISKAISATLPDSLWSTMKKWSVREPNCAQQQNETDCGVFCATNVRTLCKNEIPTAKKKDASHIRSVVADLLKTTIQAHLSNIGVEMEEQDPITVLTAELTAHARGSPQPERGAADPWVGPSSALRGFNDVNVNSDDDDDDVNSDSDTENEDQDADNCFGQDPTDLAFHWNGIEWDAPPRTFAEVCRELLAHRGKEGVSRGQLLSWLSRNPENMRRTMARLRANLRERTKYFVSSTFVGQPWISMASQGLHDMRRVGPQRIPQPKQAELRPRTPLSVPQFRKRTLYILPARISGDPHNMRSIVNLQSSLHLLWSDFQREPLRWPNNSREPKFFEIYHGDIEATILAMLELDCIRIHEVRLAVSSNHPWMSTPGSNPSNARGYASLAGVVTALASHGELEVIAISQGIDSITTDMNTYLDLGSIPRVVAWKFWHRLSHSLSMFLHLHTGGESDPNACTWVDYDNTFAMQMAKDLLRSDSTLQNHDALITNNHGDILRPARVVLRAQWAIGLNKLVKGNQRRGTSHMFGDSTSVDKIPLYPGDPTTIKTSVPKRNLQVGIEMDGRVGYSKNNPYTNHLRLMELER
ncbi:hypothetical protein HBI16_061360 [Parastagonospora nodorum]|nr:hypothetical protein HBI16_061360 [Parastagonospora nodorum]